MNVSINPIRKSIPIISPIMVFISPLDILIELKVFFLSLIMDQINQVNVITQRIIVKISILFSPFNIFTCIIICFNIIISY